MSMIEQFKSARRVSVPLVTIITPDPAATMRTIYEFYENKVPILRWDFARGVAAVNKKGEDAVTALAGGQDADSMTNPSEVLRAAYDKLPKESILFFQNVQLYATRDNPQVLQCIWNLRDAFKGSRRTLVMLAPYYEAPPELANDIVTLDEPLPNPEELTGIVKRIVKSAEKSGIAEVTEATIAKAVDALRGLPAFPAEQVTAMSLRQEGIDLPALWERKRQMIEATPGLSVWRGGEQLSDLGGLTNLKTFLKQVLNGKAAPRAIVFIDEIEKDMAGATGIGDSSGVSQAMLKLKLKFMQDQNMTGIILVGPAGTGKSAIAKAAGNEVGIPCVQFDLATMKDVYVGASEQRMAYALKMVSAVSDNQALFLATCNSIAVLPPELRRRYSLGIFFCDLPEKEERDMIWKIYLKKYGFEDTQKQPPDDGWTPAEIKQCVDIAWRLDCNLMDAAKFVVPVSVSAKESITNLRKIAHNRFISANEPGFYKYKGTDLEKLDVEPHRMIGGEVN